MCGLPTIASALFVSFWSCFCRELFVLPWAFCFCRELFAFAVSFLFCREVFAFAVSFLVLPWAFYFCRDTFGFAVRYLFCRELFGFAVSFLVLPWAFWFRREQFGFAVTLLVLPWGICYCRDSCGARYPSWIYIRAKDVCTWQRRHCVKKIGKSLSFRLRLKLSKQTRGADREVEDLLQMLSPTISLDSVLKWREYSYISETRSTNVNIPQTVLPLTNIRKSKTKKTKQGKQLTFV